MNSLMQKKLELNISMRPWNRCTEPLNRTCITQLYGHIRQGGCGVCWGISMGSETTTTPKPQFYLPTLIVIFCMISLFRIPNKDHCCLPLLFFNNSILGKICRILLRPRKFSWTPLGSTLWRARSQPTLGTMPGSSSITSTLQWGTRSETPLGM